MSEVTRSRFGWFFVALLIISGVVLFQGGSPAVASDDHDQARALRHAGDIVPLSELMQRPELAGRRVLEVKLEREHDSMVYELELLDESGRVEERYYDAVTGQLLKETRGD